MPIIESTYNPPFLFKNYHFNTIYRPLFSKEKATYSRKRILTDDNDFIDIDLSKVNNATTIVIAIHGLEGSSQSKYIISVVNYLNTRDIDVAALNLRGCSGEDNQNAYSYNSGKTDDLELVVNYLVTHYNYKNIVLLGYSMGGNIALKYMGETSNMPSQLRGAVTLSVPCDLKGSSESLAKKTNSIYMKRFLKLLKSKALLKKDKFPEYHLNEVAILSATNFSDFDNEVTAPLFGFKNAEDYWNKCSCKQFISDIKKPTLLINALDDSFLSQSCYPVREAQNNPMFMLEMPKYGGHVGFNTSYFRKDLHWSEKRIFSFIEQIIN